MADQLGHRIASARREAGLTQEQMAPQIGVALRTLTRYESGKTQRISTDMLLEISRVTRKPLTYFLDGVAA